MTEPRIPPLPADELDDRARELLTGLLQPSGQPLNIFGTLVRHPRLFRRFTAFGGVLLTGTIPARDRELLILRTGHNCASPYEWAQHVVIGRQAGLTDEEIERIVAGPDAEGWTPFEATLLRAADELHVDNTLSDATWAALAEGYGTEQLIELPMLVGQYHLVAFTLNALGVQLEDPG